MNIYTLIIYIIAAAIILWRIRAAYRTGLVGELGNAISIVLALVIGYLLKNIIVGFFSARYGSIIACLSMLAVIVLIYRIVKLIIVSLKIFASLPVIRFINKILGAILGFAEGFAIIIFLVKLLKDILKSG